MIKLDRQQRIMTILRRDGIVDVATLLRLMPEVSTVTLRRDLADLAEAGALKRTHGGAVLPDAAVLVRSRPDKPGASHSDEPSDVALEHLDAVILPPIPGRGGDALRRPIVQSGIPFLAESAPQSGGLYLGPNNEQAARELGLLAGAEARAASVTILMICKPELANTRERAEGFERGFRQAFGGGVTVIRVNGQSSYRAALRVAADAFAIHRDVDVVFGVNDHSALAGLDAAERAGRQVAVYVTGGESADFVARLAENGPIRAVAAFFPDVVGARAIDLVASALSGIALPPDARTPHAILTAANLDDYYRMDTDIWVLRPDRLADLIGPGPVRADRLPRARVGFMPHYPAHNWYRAMILAMQARAAGYGMKLIVTPPHQGIAAEISRLRCQVGVAAAARIRSGQTVIVGQGEASRYLADDLRRRAFAADPPLQGVTVITNALDVMDRLHDAPGLKVILTGGEYQKVDRCFVGPSLGALFERIRADTAFLSVDGISRDFGISAADERLALVGSRFVLAARHVVALADHTAIGADANHRIARSSEVDDIIADDGTLPADRQALRSAGIEVIVAGEPDHDPTLQETPPPVPRQGDVHGNATHPGRTK